MASKVFDSLGAGRGRAYPMSKEDKQKKLDQLKNYDWFNELGQDEKKEKIPDFNGFLKVDENTLTGWLTAAQMSGEPIKIFLDLKKIASDDGSLKQININTFVSTKAAKAPANKKSDDDFPGWDDDVDDLF